MTLIVYASFATVFAFACALASRAYARRTLSIYEQCRAFEGARTVAPLATTDAPKQLPYRLRSVEDAGSVYQDDPIVALEMALTRQRHAEDQRDDWRDEALRYAAALKAVVQLNHVGCCGIAKEALAEFKADEDDS